MVSHGNDVVEGKNTAQLGFLEELYSLGSFNKPAMEIISLLPYFFQICSSVSLVCNEKSRSLAFTF